MKMKTVTCLVLVTVGIYVLVPHCSAVATPEFKLGMLTYYNTCCSAFSGEITHGAISIAVDDLVRDRVLTHGNFSVIWRDARSPSAAAGNVVEYVLHENVDVIIGSPHSPVSAAAGHLTSFWNFPQISWVSTSPVLSNKALYPTFVRTLGPFSSVGLGFLSIFYDFNWSRIGILYTSSSATLGLCMSAVTGIRKWVDGTNITIVQTVTYFEPTVSITQTDKYLSMLKKSSRIIFLCDHEHLRQFMIRACALGMCNGEYVFLSAFAVENKKEMEQKKPWAAGDTDDIAAKHAFRYLIYITIAQYYDDTGRQNLVRFETDAIRKTAEPPWNDSYGLRNNLTASKYAPFLYDAVYFYGLWLKHCMETGTDIHDGRAMFGFTKGLSFLGMTGPVYFDDNGDRIPLYWIWDFTHPEGYPRIAAIADTRRREVYTDGWKGFSWQTANSRPPPDAPSCGFHNEFCTEVLKDNTGVVVGVCIAILFVVAGVVFAAYLIRQRQMANRMIHMIWKVDLNEIELLTSKIGAGSRISLNRSVLSIQSDTSAEKPLHRQTMTPVGIIRGQMVAIKSLTSMRYNLTRANLLELAQMRELQNENINPFIGACLESVSPSAFFTYCPKGSLQDILENDDIKLDMLFKQSLMQDLVQGMCYLHSSKLGSHGRLKSNNCLVDNRWVLKVTDYGMGRFLQQCETNAIDEHEHYKSMLWTAPEFLNMQHIPINGTKAGDVYSFGIILHEIYFRMGAFAGTFDVPFKGIINRVKNREAKPCRPEIFNTDTNLPKTVTKLMQLCWADDEQQRPSFGTIRSYVKKNIKHVNKNIVDIMIQRLEKYACNLEDIVDQRTKQLMDEKQKTDSLLYRMIPKPIAIKLKMGEAVVPELFSSATVFFSDIVGFTGIAVRSSPIEVVDLLNDLYTHFDEIIERYDAYKVETIGDAYLVVSGIPKRNGDLHAGVIADMSLVMLTGLLGFKIRHLPRQRLMVRIGMHTGPCCAGVVGVSMPRYCLFGDTVNTASRMESNGESQKIHLSHSAHMALLDIGGYRMAFRKEMEIKGKGLMKTFWLLGNQERGVATDEMLLE